MKACSGINSLDLSSILESTVQSCISHYYEPVTTNGSIMVNRPFIGDGFSKWQITQDPFFYDHVQDYGGIQTILERLWNPSSNPTEDIVANLKVKAPEYPISDLYLEEDGTMRIEIAITGFDPDDILIRGVGTKLIVKGVVKNANKKASSENERKIYGKIKIDDFELSYECGDIYDTEKTVATVARGILVIRVPLKEENTPKKFTINIKK